MAGPNDLTFLAPPGAVADWRMVLLCDAAIATGVFDKLPGTAEEVAERAGLAPEALRVVCEALVTLEVLNTDGDRRFSLGSAAPEPAAMPSVRHHARALRRWATGVESQLRGESTSSENADPETFHDALRRNAQQVAPAVVDAVMGRFPDARSVLDLGGLHGEYSLEFTRRGLKATMQDMPAMIDVARRRGRLEAAGVDLYEGSFFDSVPDGPFDVAFCSGITHTFGPEQNLTLFRNLRPVVAAGGGVAVVTFLRGRDPMAALFAVQMLLNDNGGDTHTEAEYRGWLAEAGFAVDEGVLDLPGQGARSVLFAT
ncbi:MAG TPA: class I SAM-dependent methyltransferase [Acidimicrobiales bacterium]|nr:class I SAM-dependent methyltransferase [Acidimicrobiales bacterium]